jgi:isocitrate/isopropylmalate dehydrogenase
MLEWLAEKKGDAVAFEEAQKIEHAIRKLLIDNRKTVDIGGSLSTLEFTKAVIDLMY